MGLFHHMQFVMLEYIYSPLYALGGMVAFLVAMELCCHVGFFTTQVPWNVLPWTSNRFVGNIDLNSQVLWNCSIMGFLVVIY